MTTRLWWSEVDLPVGRFGLASSERGLVGLFFESELLRRDERLGQLVGAHALRRDEAPNRAAAGQLEEYAAGQRRRFDLPLDPRGTPFQLRVWELVRSIPYGETRTYAWLAGRLGGTGAVRAVGAAVGANPLALLVPCHRVVGSEGELRGYRWGLERKRALLELEGGLGLFG